MSWISVDSPPEEGDRYWCYVESQSCLGLSHYQWNYYYNDSMGEFITEDGDRVTHWQPLPQPPKEID